LEAIAPSRSLLTPPRLMELADEIRQLAGAATPEGRSALEEVALRYLALAAGLDPGDTTLYGVGAIGLTRPVDPLQDRPPNKVIRVNEIASGASRTRGKPSGSQTSHVAKTPLRCRD